MIKISCYIWNVVILIFKITSPDKISKMSINKNMEKDAGMRRIMNQDCSRSTLIHHLCHQLLIIRIWDRLLESKMVEAPIYLKIDNKLRKHLVTPNHKIKKHQDLLKIFILLCIDESSNKIKVQLIEIICLDTCRSRQLDKVWFRKCKMQI